MEVLHWYCMWGCFSAAGTDDVDCVPGIMESQEDHFKQDVMVSVDKFHFGGHWTFNEDNKMIVVTHLIPILISTFTLWGNQF